MSPRRADLHTHTTASDGTLSPRELVTKAARAGLAAVAVTDHDVTFGAAEAVSAGAELGVEVIPGVEVSAEWPPGQMHVLGLWIDPADAAFNRWLAAILGGRNERNRRIVGRLRELGVDIDLAEVEAVAGEGAVGRPHIAQVLIAKGAAADHRQAFDRYLAKGSAAYFDRLRATPAEAVERIHAAGGLAVLAHPHYCGARDAAELGVWVGQLRDAGLDGIEVRYSTFSAAHRRTAEALARRFDLLPSGGSDFHGAAKPAIRLGVGRGDLVVPAEWVEGMKEALARRHEAAAGAAR
jgi:predicted metal-dependent phosphoesterase TrpH